MRYDLTFQELSIKFSKAEARRERQREHVPGRIDT